MVPRTSVPHSIFTRGLSSRQRRNQSPSALVSQRRRAPGKIWFAAPAEKEAQENPHR